MESLRLTYSTALFMKLGCESTGQLLGDETLKTYEEFCLEKMLFGSQQILLVMGWKRLG